MKVLVTATLVTGLILSGSTSFAFGQSSKVEPTVVSKETKEIVDSSSFIKFSGVISNSNIVEKSITLTVENKENGNTMIFPITDEVLLLNSVNGDSLQTNKMKNGIKVDVYYDKNKPMTLIYPARITPDIVIVEDNAMGQVKISKFNDDHMSLDNTLMLHISKETVLLNEKGEKIKEEELKGKELIVFYDITTRSIPAQTTPKKIIALDNSDQLPLEINQLIEEDQYIKNETNMIPLRKVAEKLGYKVDWQKKDLGVIISKQNRSFQISIEKKEYGYNRSMRYFDVAPEIKNGKTYVSEEFLKMLVE